MRNTTHCTVRGFFFILISSVACQVPNNLSSSSSILTFWREQDDQFQLGSQKDIVLILGGTGVGKSTLASLLIDANLQAFETRENSGLFRIVDEDNLISRGATITSETLVPNLMLDEKTGTTYYDCPGFSDTRSVAHDITISYFLNKLLNYANSVKLVFVVSGNSVQIGGDRKNFLESMKHLIELVKNVDKYRDGVALIVTKVDNDYRKKGRNLMLIDDETVIENCAQFLNESKYELMKKSRAELTEKDRRINDESITFINTFLIKQNSEYQRIGIFRKVDESGPLKDMELVQDEKRTITKIINQNLHFVVKSDSDFGYSLSAESKNRINDLIQEIQSSLAGDVQVIGYEINQFYTLQEKNVPSTQSLYETMRLGYQSLSQIEASEPNSLLKEILNATQALGIRLSRDVLNAYRSKIEYITFLTTVSDQHVTNTLKVSNAFHTIQFRLNNAKKWYRFLNDLYDKLSTYEFISKSDVKPLAIELIQQCSIGENATRNISSINLERFLSQLKINVHPDDSIQQVNSFQLKKLRALLNRITNNEVKSSCADDTLRITGFYVKMSDVTSSSCYHKAKFIKVIALDRIFIDADSNKMGTGAQISIIAPIWEVFGNHTINLNGENGQEHSISTANHGVGGTGRGFDGKPGFSGDSAGCFFGIGGTFINHQFLSISANGGHGSSGQKGGDGSPGVEGETPTRLSDSYTEWYMKKTFEEQGFHVVSKQDGTGYTAEGKSAVRAGDGGNGGAGGLGGKAGQISIYGLRQTPNITITNIDGRNGASGSGGKGGSSAKNGKTLVLKSSAYGGSRQRSRGYDSYNYQDNGEESAGSNGADGKNSNGLKYPKMNEIRDASLLINQLKNYLIENLVDNIREIDLREFLKQLDENEQITPLYDTLGFVNELEGLENNYFFLRHKLSFEPFLVVFMHRINEFAKVEAPKSLENKKVLGLLYTATLSKVCSIRSSKRTVVDLHSYLNGVLKNIEKLEKLSAEDDIHEYRNEYKHSLDAKIGTANEFIESQIMPGIDATVSGIDNQLIALINETISKENATKSSMDQEKTRQEELQKLILTRTILAQVAFVGAAVSFLGPVGAAAGTVLGGAAMLGEAIIDREKATAFDAVSQFPVALKDQLTRLEGTLNSQNKVYKLKQEEYDRIANLKITPQTLPEDVQMKVLVLQAETDVLDRQLNTAGTSTSNIAADATLKEKAAESPIDPKDKMKQKTDRNDKYVEYVKKGTAVLDLGAVTIRSVNRIRADAAELEKAGDEVIKFQNQLQQLEEYEQRINDVMMPMIREIENTMNQMIQSLNGTSHVQLDIAKWKVQSALKDVIVYFRRMTKDFSVQDDLLRAIEKSEEGMTTLIDVYDRIDSYADNAKLAAYIADIASAKSIQIEIRDERLSAAKAKLDRIIQSNLVQEQYEVALHAFKQHSFPFAKSVLEHFILPTNLTVNDTESLTVNAVSRINDMMSHDQNSKSSILKNDRYLYDEVSFDGGSMHFAPFYVWKGRDVRKEIETLFRGEEIVLKADVVKGINQNAIKFNEIAIRFKVANEEDQRRLDRELENFHLTMKMIGYNYYRCDSTSFHISVDDDVEITYSLANDSRGMPIFHNTVYDKIRANDYFLSPYALWSLKLTKGRFSRLRSFGMSDIDLELVGTGQYLDHGPFISELCNDQLDQFYSVDNTISEF